MVDDKEWPDYPIGPRNSVFAMGLISIKFAELESVLAFLFATQFEPGLDNTIALCAKVGSKACGELMDARLASHVWPDSTKQKVRHFLRAFFILTDSRNSLMHSNLAWVAGSHTVLFKTARSGRTVAVAPTLEVLRRIADDMNAFVDYGRCLGNAINFASPDALKVFEGDFPYPDDPQLPAKLEYTGARIDLPDRDDIPR